MSEFKVSIKVTGIEEMFSEIEQSVKETRDTFVKALWRELMETTPVDTGTARASWDIASSYSEIKEVNYGLQRYGIMPAIPDGNVVVASKLDYMVFLNEGWSMQAPALFIERAVAIAYSEADK